MLFNVTVWTRNINFAFIYSTLPTRLLCLLFPFYLFKKTQNIFFKARIIFMPRVRDNILALFSIAYLSTRQKFFTYYYNHNNTFYFFFIFILTSCFVHRWIFSRSSSSFHFISFHYFDVYNDHHDQPVKEKDKYKIRIYNAWIS